MKRIASHVAVALACLAGTVAHAANTDPFDFDYEVLGTTASRPESIFNDGSQTYIQPRPHQVIVAAGGHAEGPYVVIDGTPDTIEFSVDGQSVTAHWNSANSFIGGPGTPAAFRGDQPSRFVGFSDHLVLLGQRGDIEPVRGIASTMTIGALAKALVPQGWSGSAEKDIDLTSQIAFTTQDGESWLQALDQLMNTTGLFASVDFDKRHLRLMRSAPKSVAVAYSPSNNPTVTTPVLAGAAVPTPRTEAPASESFQSQLVTVFGAQAIRDSSDDKVQIRFATKPSSDLTFETPEGSSLHPHWDRDTNIVTIDRAHVIVVSDGKNSTEIGRVPGTVYDFDPSNPAHLEAVFDADGATYFKFAPTVISVSVTDGNGQGQGEQKGSFFKFSGTASKFNVTADGASTKVVRRSEVHFYERTPS